MELIRKFGYFCDIKHFWIITGTLTDPIIPGHVRFFLHFVQFLKYITNIYPYKHNLRRFI